MEDEYLVTTNVAKGGGEKCIYQPKNSLNLWPEKDVQNGQQG